MIATPETDNLIAAMDRVEVKPQLRVFGLQDRCKNLERRLTLCRNAMVLGSPEQIAKTLTETEKP